MHLILYTSEFCGPVAQLHRELPSIIASSQRNNPAVDVTGVMFYQQLRFLQLLEGPEENVRGVMARITRDQRHSNVKILFDEPAFERGFPDWSMKAFAISDDTSLTAEYLQTISDAYRRNLKVHSSSLIGVIKGFVEEASPTDFQAL